MRVLIADDSHIIRNYVKGILERSGHEVVGVASDGPEALAMCRSLRPDVAILDYSMPAMTGDLVLEHVVAENLVRFAIFASSNTQKALTNRMEALGAFVVGKPFDKKQLLEKLGEITAAKE